MPHPYASSDDMVARYGTTEMIRLTVPDGQPMTAVNADQATASLLRASAQIDSYLRRRYQVPLDLVPSEIADACMTLARYDLSFGEQRDVPEQTRLAYKDKIEWLVGISKGTILLDLEEVPTSDESFAQASDRDDICARPYSSSGWYGGGFN